MTAIDYMYGTTRSTPKESINLRQSRLFNIDSSSTVHMIIKYSLFRCDLTPLTFDLCLYLSYQSYVLSHI